MVFIMYSDYTLQVNPFIKNLLSVIEQEKGHNIEAAIQLEVSFITNKDKKGLYKSYDRQYEYQKIAHNNRKVPTVYCAPRLRNILATHLFINF